MVRRSKVAAALLRSLTVLGLLAWTGQAVAQFQAMDPDNPTCPVRNTGWPSALSFTVYESGGYRILIATGAIAAHDDARLDAFLRGAGRIDEIWLDSPGGDAAEGPRIGEMIRRHKLATRVPAGFYCASSCTIAFLGGVVRNVDPGGAYAVHRFYSAGYMRRELEVERLLAKKFGRDLAAEQLSADFDEQQGQDEVLAASWQEYIQRMGIARAFLTDVVLKQASQKFATQDQHATIRCLDHDTLTKYNVVNEEE